MLSTYWKVLGSCISQDCICLMVKSIFIGQQLSQLVPSRTFFCENTETLARLSFFFSSPHLLSHGHPPPSLLPLRFNPAVLPLLNPLTRPPPKVPELGACKDVYNVFIFFLCEKFRTLLPPSPRLLSFVVFPFRSLCKVYITMVLFYTILCNLPL